MFESSVVESKKRRLKKNRLMVLPVSVGLHAGAVAGLLFASAWSVSLPADAPPQIAAFVVRVPAPAMADDGGSRPRPAAPQPAHPRPAAIPHAAPPTEPAPDEQTPSQIPGTVPDLEPGSGGWPSGGGDGIVDVGGGGSGDPGTGSGIGGGGTGVDEIPVPVGGNVAKPQILSRVDPHYPDLLVKMKMRGTATVECIVDREGKVESVRTVSATHPLFAESASRAVQQWRFRPGRMNGRTVKTIFNLTVTFELKR